MYDYVFAGGGLSARILLLNLLRRFPDARYLVVDRMHTGKHDSLLTFWSSRPLLLDSLVRYTWTDLSIGNVTESLRHSSFKGIRVSDIYTYTDKVFSKYSNIELRTASVLRLVEKGHGVDVVTDINTYHGRLVFDSRYLENNTNTLYMHDYVWEVDLELGFDQRSLVFLDYIQLIDGSVSFMYVIPTLEHHAQIHLVIMSVSQSLVVEPEIHLKQFMRYKGWTTRNPVPRFRYFILPLHDVSYPVTPSVIPIGGRAGWIKPTTGYGLKNIFINTTLICEQLPSQIVRNNSRGWLFRSCDSLMFHIIRSDPPLALYLLQQLVSKGNFEEVMAFLNDEGSIFTIVKVMLCLPVHTMMYQWLRYTLTRD